MTPQPDANGWYPIESAPKELFDGRFVEVWDGGSEFGMCWGNYWVNNEGNGINPTHLRPIGPPPVGAEK
jgi:hypothetical protein